MRRLDAAALHVTNGDSAAAGIRATGLADRILPWRDALHEGPVPAGVSDPELRRLRAGFLAGDVAAERDAIERWLEHRDETLAANRHADYVLWFEADLYDQLQLAQILARLGELDVPSGRITLICIGEHAGIAHFGGLGELEPEQLVLLPERVATGLDASALALASAAWAAFRADDPRGLAPVATARSGELRFLPEAFERLGREYPSTRDGLSLTERRVLAAVADGAATAGEAHVHAARKEARPFLGDLLLFRIVDRLAAGASPLLLAEPAGAAAVGTRLGLTPAGERVLRGAADHVDLNGIDRWVGGVHLTGNRVHWRFDEGTEAVLVA